MSRKNKAQRREINADPIYRSKLASRFINKIMQDGKKSLAENIFYDAMDLVAEKTEENSMEVLKAALNNVMPVLEIKTRRVGGANYQVPVEADNRRRLTLGLRWMIQAARDRSERKMVDRVANEIIAAYNEEGGAVRKKEEVHRMAEANKAFAHYRW
ncbi:ribosomal protein S7, bacterial/organelle [Halobacteroides halobius DSM 5150]|uniref:Small ribosomal subunit protein uS7 n=1 Tax=Halobacteroides halobius (strain ATCC 35273 / DSM 5150 / MD-1) TaxID=748449 RepID=L0K4J8_HALHC|nr:30S ribosomal protein S7 [Halobacteroides halobius]AGB40197.1 ribosomal protein S7, bacterial/organelle [Halobacteroides halobius DSM 5150]